LCEEWQCFHVEYYQKPANYYRPNSFPKFLNNINVRNVMCRKQLCFLLGLPKSQSSSRRLALLWLFSFFHFDFYFFRNKQNNTTELNTPHLRVSEPWHLLMAWQYSVLFYWRHVTLLRQESKDDMHTVLCNFSFQFISHA
jgi:hypothetical protein